MNYPYFDTGDGCCLIDDTGVGYAARKITAASNKSFQHFYESITMQSLNPCIKFKKLEVEWKEETIFLSSTSEIAMHPSYQQIIGMGVIALPFIFDSMRRELGHWFWALRAITGINPVPKEHRGNIKLMTKDWFDWYETNRLF